MDVKVAPFQQKLKWQSSATAKFMRIRSVVFPLPHAYWWTQYWQTELS